MALNIKKPSATGGNGATDTDVWYVPVVSGTGYNSDFVAYTTDTPFAGIGNALVAGKLYVFVATTDAWICQSNAGTAASKAVGSIFVKAGNEKLIDGAQGTKVHVLQDTAGGNASIVEVTA